MKFHQKKVDFFYEVLSAEEIKTPVFYGLVKPDSENIPYYNYISWIIIFLCVWLDLGVWIVFYLRTFI